MPWTSKRLRRALHAVSFGVGAALVLMSCHQQEPPPLAPRSAPPPAMAEPSLPVYGTLPELQLVDQENRPFTGERMHGRVWIANFIFTTCTMACPILSQRMEVVQRKVQSQSPNLQLVSFSILPTVDTPPVLKAYGAKFHQDPSRWTFVTGKPDAILDSVSKGYKQVLAQEKQAATGTNFLSDHGEIFVLIDGAGRIRGYYRKDNADLDRLIADAAKLTHGSP